MNPFRFLPFLLGRARSAVTRRSIFSPSRWRRWLRRTGEEWARFESPSLPHEATAVHSAPTARIRYHVDLFALQRDPFSGDWFLLLRGWLCVPGGGTPARLAVAREGATILEVSCDQPRPDVAAALHDSAADYPTLPRCGFADQVQLEGAPGAFELLWGDSPIASAAPPGPTASGHLPLPWSVHGHPFPRDAARRSSRDGLREDRRNGAGLDGSLRALFFSHTLGLEGMPRLLLRLAGSLSQRGAVRATLASPVDGPMRRAAERQGLGVALWRMDGIPAGFQGWSKAEEYARSVAAAAGALRSEKPDVVVVSTLHGFFVVDAAAEAGIPCVWAVQEHYGASLLSRLISPCARDRLENAFGQASRIVFASRDTMELYRPFQQRGNFRMVHNRVDVGAADRTREALSVGVAREQLGLPAEPLPILISVGTICNRKDQMTFVRACELLAESRSDFLALLVGATESDPGYSGMLRRRSTSLRERGLLRIVPGTDRIDPYYRAADVFVLTSLVESFSFAVLEAMSYGLAVVTTPCGGVAEQVRHGSSALSVPFRDHVALAEAVASLLDDPARRESLGAAARERLEALGDESEMVDDYAAIIASAASQAGPFRP